MNLAGIQRMSPFHWMRKQVYLGLTSGFQSVGVKCATERRAEGRGKYSTVEILLLRLLCLKGEPRRLSAQLGEPHLSSPSLKFKLALLVWPQNISIVFFKADNKTFKIWIIENLREHRGFVFYCDALCDICSGKLLYKYSFTYIYLLYMRYIH